MICNVIEDKKNHFNKNKAGMSRQVSYVVIRSTKETATKVWVPWEAIALLLVAPQTEIWGAFSRRVFNRNNVSVKKPVELQM